MREILPQAYNEYSEDIILSITQLSDEKAIFKNGLKMRKAGPSPAPLIVGKIAEPAMKSNLIEIYITNRS
jgi:hypothetical protein